jgi:hypothetical protein
VASHLPIESLKTRSGLEPVPGFEPLRNPVPARLESDGLTTAPWRPVSSTLCSCLYPINVQARCPGHTQQGILYMHFPTEQKGQYIPRPLTHQSWGGHWLGWGKNQWAHRGVSILRPEPLRRVPYRLSYNPPLVKARSGLEPVPGCEPRTYQPLRRLFVVVVFVFRFFIKTFCFF